MLLDSIKKITGILIGKIKEVELGEPNFADSRYINQPFDKDNFKTFNLADNGRKIAFIDGGNLEILSAPNFSISLIRIYFNIFKNNKRIIPKNIPSKMELFSISSSRPENGKILYETNIIPVDEKFSEFLPEEKHLCFDSFDPTIVYGNKFRANISTIGSVVRRFAEWNYSSFIIEKELEEGDMIVRDGTLQTAVTNEARYSDKAYASAEKYNVIFSALAKTSTLFTSTGLSLIAAVRKLSETNGLKDKCWFYYPIVKNMHPDHKAEIYACKLHENSKHVFRFEIYRKQAEALKHESIKEIFQSLANNSNDLSFLGYPYGFIDADKFARVSYSELNTLKALLQSELSKNGLWEEVSKYISTENVHDILNII